MNARRTYVIAYDIRDTRRLVRVHRALTRLGHPMQYSVFAADFTPGEKAAALVALGGLMDRQTDDMRIYPVPASPFGGWRGPRLSPGGVSVLPSPAATLAERLSRNVFSEATQ